MQYIAQIDGLSYERQHNLEVPLFGECNQAGCQNVSPDLEKNYHQMCWLFIRFDFFKDEPIFLFVSLINLHVFVVPIRNYHRHNWEENCNRSVENAPQICEDQTPTRLPVLGSHHFE